MIPTISKNHRTLLLILLIVLLSLVGYQPLEAQKTMKLNDDLMANSEPIIIKPKATTGYIMRYGFGEYQLTSSKEGVDKSEEIKDTVTVDGKPYREIYIVDGKSYVRYNKYGKAYKFQTMKQRLEEVKLEFVGPSNTIVKADFNFREKSIASEAEKLNSNSSTLTSAMSRYEKSFKSHMSKTDGVEWTLIVNLLFQKGEGIYFEGSLSNGSETIQIFPVNKWEDGKTVQNVLNLGFEFYQGDRAIAAVQGSRNTIHKKLVWLRNDLEDDLKLMLALSAITMAGVSDGSHGPF